MVRVLGSFALVLSLILPVCGALAQEQSKEQSTEQSREQAAEPSAGEEAEESAGGALKERRGIEPGRPVAESWAEILETREKLQSVKKRWQKTHWLNDNRRSRARNAARRMTTLTLEIEQNAELEELVAIKLHRAGQLLRWRLGQVVAVMDTEGTLMLEEIIGNVDLDLHNFYDKVPAGTLGPRGLPPLSGAEEPAGKPAQPGAKPSE